MLIEYQDKLGKCSKKTDIHISTNYLSNLTLITHVWPSSLALCKSNANLLTPPSIWVNRWQKKKKNNEDFCRKEIKFSLQTLNNTYGKSWYNPSLPKLCSFFLIIAGRRQPQNLICWDEVDYDDTGKKTDISS